MSCCIGKCTPHQRNGGEEAFPSAVETDAGTPSATRVGSHVALYFVCFHKRRPLTVRGMHPLADVCTVLS
jgi:hypothetical protein